MENTVNNFIPMTGVDLMIQFQSDTGIVIEDYINVLKEETFVKSNESKNVVKYMEWVEARLLKYKNAEEYIRVANVEAATVIKEEEDE